MSELICPSPRIFVGIAATGNCKTHFSCCKDQLMAYFWGNLLSPECKQQEITTERVASSGLCHNYHALVRMAQQWKATHLLTLEEDMAFEPDVLHILYRRHQLWVGANYPMKKQLDWEFTAASLNSLGRVMTRPTSSGLEECGYTGMGVTLFDMKLFDMIEPPWFVMDYVGNESYCTQDAYFAAKVHDADISIYVDHDVSNRVSHIGDYQYTCQEASARIDAQTIKEGEKADGK